mmetsp:Transcript_28543/g.67021  ORF Transcript_28543/g.67021 Transcript_28543/m.67021 type:complete len:225 (-) Transcript_28543:800-1474(-)
MDGWYLYVVTVLSVESATAMVKPFPLSVAILPGRAVPRGTQLRPWERSSWYTWTVEEAAEEMARWRPSAEKETVEPTVVREGEAKDWPDSQMGVPGWAEPVPPEEAGPELVLVLSYVVSSTSCPEPIGSRSSLTTSYLSPSSYPCWASQSSHLSSASLSGLPPALYPTLLPVLEEELRLLTPAPMAAPIRQTTATAATIRTIRPPHLLRPPPPQPYTSSSCSLW